MDRISFWKPDKISNDSNDLCELLPIGKLEDVTDRLCRIPNMRTVPSAEKTTTLYWNVDRGIFLYFRPDSANNILYLSANSFTSLKVLYRFYVQLFEHLELVLLNEDEKKFYSLQDFKKLIPKKESQ